MARVIEKRVEEMVISPTLQSSRSYLHCSDYKLILGLESLLALLISDPFLLMITFLVPISH